MKKDGCPKFIKCPLFSGKILENKASTDIYKNLYCLNGKEKYTTCKRYITSEKVGKCPGYVMPNSSLSIEEIIQRMKKEGLLGKKNQ